MEASVVGDWAPPAVEDGSHVRTTPPRSTGSAWLGPRSTRSLAGTGGGAESVRNVQVVAVVCPSSFSVTTSHS